MNKLINNCPNCDSDWVSMRYRLWTNGYGQETKVRYYIECGKCNHKSIESISEIIALQNWNGCNIKND